MLSIGGTAHAQGTAPTRQIDIGATLTTSYDSNVLRRSDAVLAGRDPEDFRSSPALRADILYPIGRQTVLLEGSIGYDFYKRNSQLNRERINVLGGAVLRAGPSCTANLTGEYARGQSDLADSFFGQQVKNTQETGAFDAQIGCQAPVGLRPSIGFRTEQVTNSDLGRQRNDFSAETYRASIGYARPALGEISLYGSIRKGRYPRRLSVGGTGERIDVYSGGVRFSRSIGSRIRGTLAGGYTVVEPKQPGVKRFSGASYSVDLVWTPNEATQLAIVAARDAQQSNLLDISYTITDSVAVSGEYRLSRMVAFTGSGSYVKRRFEASPLVMTPFLREGDRTYRVSGGVRLSPPGRLSMNFDVTGAQRRSDNPLFNYGHVIAAATVRFGL